MICQSLASSVSKCDNIVANICLVYTLRWALLALHKMRIMSPFFGIYYMLE